MAAGKEGKKAAREEGGATAALLHRIAEEITALRADVDALKARGAENAAVKSAKPPTSQGQAGEKGKEAVKALQEQLQERVQGEKDAAVVVGYSYRIKDEEGNIIGANDLCLHGGLQGIIGVDEARVARLGYAFASVPKIALLRHLLWDGPQTAAQLGEKAKLTTGSLYHHLRELAHAGVIESASGARGRHALTESGRQTALYMFVQAGRD